MGKIVCPECGRQMDSAKARVCYSCDTTVCPRCAAKKQNICGRCYDCMGYMN